MIPDWNQEEHQGYDRKKQQIMRRIKQQADTFFLNKRETIAKSVHLVQLRSDVQNTKTLYCISPKCQQKHDFQEYHCLFSVLKRTASVGRRFFLYCQIHFCQLFPDQLPGSFVFRFKVSFGNIRLKRPVGGLFAHIGHKAHLGINANSPVRLCLGS